jgi:regulatory protein
MKSLVRRARLSGEITKNLQAKGFSAPETEAALELLARNGLIDDEKTIREHVEARSGRRAVGADKLRAELLRRGATESQVEGTLSLRTENDEVAAMLAALEGRRWNEEDRNRAGRFLASRGFQEDLIPNALDRLFGPVESE